ncbi:melatonin receptor type 1A-like [Porites lutea]|uniref:melatonin receptor type 1A-like n=1 Tax=Porites lutea TaxID=51062 RepID=UPI003CC5FFDE
MADALVNRSFFLTSVEVFFLVILNVLSLTGNIMVCIAVYKNTRLRRTTSLYIIALAVSDLMSGVFVMPFALGVLITGEWVFGPVICHFHAFFVLFVVYASTVTVGLTAFDRYMRICKSEQQYKKIFSPRKSRAWLACAWFFIACYIAVPKLAGLQDYAFIPGYALCAVAHLSESGKIIHYTIVISLFFLTPLITTVFSYIKVAKTIRQHNAAMSSTIHRGATGSSISVQELKLSKSLFVVVFAFMICWIPSWAIVVVKRFHFVERMPRNIELLCNFFIYLSNAINPFIYAGMNPIFKSEFKQIFCCERRFFNGINPQHYESNTAASKRSTRTAALQLGTTSTRDRIELLKRTTLR